MPRETVSACEVCGGKGFVHRRTERYPEGAMVRCRCHGRDIALRRTRALLERSGLDDTLLRRYTFDSFRPEAAVAGAAGREALAEVKAACVAYAANPEGWLVLSGPYGCGKTHLAYAIAGALVDQRSVYAGSVPQMMQMLREGFDAVRKGTGEGGPRRDRGPGFDERLATLHEADVVVLDDLGAEQHTAWAADILYQIVGNRYLKRLPLVVTTNVNLHAPRGAIEPRVVSRLMDGAYCQDGWSRVFFIEAQDYRQRRG